MTEKGTVSSTTAIALISGKGGTGKTSVCIAIGYMLADLGFRTAIIDADPATHGMTYFFSGRLGNRTTGLFDLTDDKHLSSIGLLEDTAEGYLSFVPSIGDLEKQTDPHLRGKKLTRVITQADIDLGKLNFDFILFDCQAGFNPSVVAILQFCKSAIVVTEADPVSIWAVNGLYRQLVKSQALPPTLFGVINKVMSGEEDYYKAIVDITSHIEFIAQVPFDKDVRRAFFRKEVPIDLDNASPFVTKLSKILKKIAPIVSERIDTKKTWRISTQAAEADKRAISLENLLRETEERLYYLRNKERRRYSIQRMSGFIAGFLYGIAGIFLFVLDIGPSALAWTFVGIGAFVLILAAVLPTFLPGLSSRRLDELRGEVERLDEVVRAVREQLAEYEILRRLE